MLRVVDVLYSQPRRRLRQELHQPARVLARYGLRIKIGFNGDNARDQVRIHAVARRGSFHQFAIGRLHDWFCRRGRKDFFRFDGYNFFRGDFRGAPGHLQTVFVPDELIARHGQPLATAQHYILRSQSRRCEHNDAEQ